MNKGITEPLEPITLPYLVPQKTVLFKVLDLDIITFSINALLIPIALIGYAALSVLRITTFFRSYFSAAFNTLLVPKILVLTASRGKNSHDGTCFNAAA